MCSTVSIAQEGPEVRLCCSCVVGACPDSLDPEAHVRAIGLSPIPVALVGMASEQCPRILLLEQKVRGVQGK